MQPMGLKQGNNKPFTVLLLLCNRLKFNALAPICSQDSFAGTKITHLNVS